VCNNLETNLLWVLRLANVRQLISSAKKEKCLANVTVINKH
jgi:hypothetical protein